MGQHADELLPRFHLLALHQHRDILQRHHEATLAINAQQHRREGTAIYHFGMFRNGLENVVGEECARDDGTGRMVHPVNPSIRVADEEGGVDGNDLNKLINIILGK